MPITSGTNVQNKDAGSGGVANSRETGWDCQACWHWGQGGTYPVGTWWVHCEFWKNSPTQCPLDTLWVLFKSTHQSTYQMLCERNPWVLSQFTPQSTQWVLCERSQWVLSQLTSKCAHQRTWATHWEFFQKVPPHVITMYSAIYSMSSLRVCGRVGPHCEFFVSSLKRTHWVCYDHMKWEFLKELSMSGSDSLMGTFAG